MILRSKKREFKVVGISLDKDILDKIDELSEIEMLYNRSAVVRRAVEYYYNRVKGGNID